MYKIPAILLSLLTCFVVFAQRTIKGRVVNASNGEPIPGSSVFINNSSKGLVSDRLGQFELNDIPAGKHDLITSSIGYETSVFSFSAEQLPLQVKIEMQIKVRELENVTLEPSVEEGWDKWGKMFTDYFVGNIPNAASCKIKNHKAIRFRYYKKSNRIIAYADEPIVLENKALGYNIKYQLEDFEVDFKSGAMMFAGYPFFEEMDKNKKKWLKNREKAYYGSMLHFMRGLYQNNLADNGFEVRRMTRVPNQEKERVKKFYLPIKINAGVKVSGNKVTVNQPDSLNKDSVEYYEKILRQKDYTEVYGTSLLMADSLVIQTDGNYKVIFLPITSISPIKGKKRIKHIFFFIMKTEALFFRDRISGLSIKIHL